MSISLLEKFHPDIFVSITGYYGRLDLLTQGQLTDLSLNSLFTKLTTVCETVEAKCPQKLAMHLSVCIQSAGHILHACLM